MLNHASLVGKKVGRWTLVSLHHQGRRGAMWWNVHCDCGGRKILSWLLLKKAASRSCGCLRKEEVSKRRKKHGLLKTPEYSTWISMKLRCLNKKHPAYRNYGGRGITVCESWKYSFESFLADMGPRPSKDLSIDRIDNNGNYEPSNCRWATRKQQMNNRRNTITDKVNGRQSCSKAKT